MDLSHHAYVIIGRDSARDDLKSLLKKDHKISTTGNPDFFDRSYGVFTIDDARELKSLHETRPVTDKAKKIFILKMNGITVEAQNALLKLLEEPAEYAHFFIIIPSAHLLLLTVRSRVSIITIGRDTSGTAFPKSDDSSNRPGDEKVRHFQEVPKDILSAGAFLKAPVATRLETIKKLLDDITKEKKTTQDVINFVDELEAYIRAKGGAPKDAPQKLETIQTVRTYMDDRAPSLKMLLEYVALNM